MVANEATIIFKIRFLFFFFLIKLAVSFWAGKYLVNEMTIIEYRIEDNTSELTK